MRTRASRTNEVLKNLSIFLVLILGTIDLMGQDYGSMYIPSASSTQLKLSNDNWHYVGNGDTQFLADQLSNWNVNTANTLIAEAGGAGEYLLKYSLGFLGTAGEWEIGIYRNSELLGVKRVFISGKRQQTVNAVSEIFVSINAGDQIKMAVRPAEKMARFTLSHARVTVIENESGALDFSSAAFSVGICKSYTADDWTSLSGFQCTKVNEGWTPAEENITASAAVAGRYLISYDTWFSARSAGGANIHKVRDLVSFGISTDGENNNANAAEMTIPVSDLRNEFANGFGIMEIEAGDNIGMKVMAGTPKTAVILYRATISLYKLKDEPNLSRSNLPHSDLDRLPADIALNQNFPNPFNPETQISYTLPESGQVRLTVYNMQGGEMAQLVNTHQSAGQHTAAWNASHVAAGTYLYVLEVGGIREVRKMTLIK